MSTHTQVEVLVSGAGPAGLFFAFQMASRGHSVCIVDPKPGPTEQSRAILITSRTMEILQNKGLAADILYHSFAGSGMRLYRNGSVVAEIDAGGDTSFPQLTGLMQAYTEKTINEHIEEYTNLKVDWNTELVSYTQDEDCVTAIIRNIHTKEEKVIKSAYIVGADGTHSRVRKDDPDWGFEGVAIKTKFGLADLTLKGKDVDKLKEKMNAFLSGTSVMGIVRINPVHEGGKEDSHVFRIFGNLEQYSGGVSDKENPSHGLVKDGKEEPFTLEFIQSWINEKTAPLQIEASDIIWSTYFRINERMAKGFRRKRAFLIGDAAHCHSPFGGQGMNLGLQDADNLAWKISDVLRKLPVDPETLLDSYGAEREPHARATIDTTSKSTKIGLGANQYLAHFRNYLLSTALILPQMRSLFFRTAMQLWVTIPPSKILGTSSKGLVQPGHFFPETGTLRKSFISKANKPRFIQRNSIQELLINNHQYVAIFVGTCPGGFKPNTHLMEKFWKDTRAYPIRRMVIQSAWHCHNMKFFPEYIAKDEEHIAEESFYNEERIENPISMTNRVGLYPLLTSFLVDSNAPPSVLVIVRPDLYVAESKVINNEKDLDDALKFFSSTYHTIQ